MADARRGMRLSEALGTATRDLGAAGIPMPRREALHLAADLFGVSPGAVVLRLSEGLGAGEAERLRVAVGRRASGEPAAYVTGIAGFRTLTVQVDPRVLIPRPETEGLVDRVLARRRDGVVVDVGTGSGCIAIALRLEGSYRAVLGVDRSADALAVARDNAARVGSQIAFFLGDLVSGLGSESVDVLVSNPPYVSEGEYSRLDASVRSHEPAAALQGGADGLEPTRRLLEDGLRVVRPDGVIALELASDRAAVTASVALACGWVDVSIEDDLFGRPRYLLARRSKA